MSQADLPGLSILILFPSHISIRFLKCSMSDDEGYIATPSRAAANSSRRRAGLVDLSLGKSPISSAIRSLQMDNSATTGLQPRPRAMGHLPVTLLSDSFGKDGLLSEAEATQAASAEINDEQLGDRDEDKRIDRLLSRLMAVQGEMDVHPNPSSPENAHLPSSHRADHNLFPFSAEQPRTLARDIPERFHTGRESLSVQKNITVRGSKRPKERSQDREYKQRYSVSPGKLIEAFGVGLREDHISHQGRSQASVVPEPGGKRLSSRMHGSSTIRDTDRNPVHTPTSVPSPRVGTHARDGGSPDHTDPYTITLIYDGRPMRHQVWGDMPVTQLLQDAASIFGFPPPYTSIVLMLFGLQPAALRIGYLLSDPPRVADGATVLVFHVGAQIHDQQLVQTHAHTQSKYAGSSPGHYGGGPQHGSIPPLPQGSKLLGNFKLNKFDGTARQWKAWNKSFMRYLSIHQLDYVIEDDFLDLLPHSQDAFAANKLVYYILEDAIVAGTLGTKYFRLAAKWNGGHQAYFCLHDAFVMSGPQTASLLLNQLANLRFSADETASGFCLRLRELFEDLEMVPGDASITMHDTQKIGYLLTGIRQEKSLDSVYVAIQTAQRRGDTTFEEACDDLHHRCEAIRADELLYTQVKDTGRKLLVSTKGKRLNQPQPPPEVDKKLCLELNCTEMIKSYLPLCPLHYHQGVSGKTPSIQLKDGLGSATYDATAHAMVYPPAVPKERLPIPKGELKPIKRKGLVAGIRFGNFSEEKPISSGSLGRDFSIDSRHFVQPIRTLVAPVNECQDAISPDLPISLPPTVEQRVDAVPLLVCKSESTRNLFYVDSGAGQCLSSCSTAFLTMEPCRIEVVGVAGSLSIFGRGTAIFALSFNDTEILIRVHNCLYSFGEFNLLSVSQMQTIRGNTLNLSLEKPSLRLYTGTHSTKRSYIDIPLGLDDGLYFLLFEPISSDDPRLQTHQMYDLTPPGDYEPCSHRHDRFVGISKGVAPSWTTSVLNLPTPQGRIFTLNGSLDFHSGLTSFSDQFLAPAGLPSARKQYDTSDPSDMSDLSIRFLGGGTDRILHTVNVSNGLKDPPSKKHARVPPLNFPQGNMKKFKTPRVTKEKRFTQIRTKLVISNFRMLRFLSTESQDMVM